MSLLSMLMTPQQLDSFIDNNHLQTIIDKQQSQLKLLAEAVVANGYKGTIYQAGGVGASMVIEEAYTLAREIIGGGE